MRVNFACGKQTWPGWYCVDAVAHPKATRPPDLLHAFKFDNGRLVNPLPIESGIATEVHAYHFIEHVYLWEAPAVLAEWRRLLKPGGGLVLELPNIEAAARNLLAGMHDQMCMWPFYGDPQHKDPFMCHRWGYTPKTLKKLLTDNGFSDIRLLPPQTHGKRTTRDMRAESRKA